MFLHFTTQIHPYERSTMKLIFNVAQFFYIIEFLNSEMPYKQLIATHAPFYVKHDVEEDMLFRISIGEALVPHTLEGLEQIGEFDCGNCLYQVARIGIDQEHPTGGYRMLIHNVDNSLAGCFESNGNFSECKVTPIGDFSNQKFGINNSIMLAFAFAAAHHDTLLMHSSVAVKDNVGYLFQGKSGTGKSTHCELWLKHIEGTQRINDDNPVVRVIKNGQAWVFGSPWSGKTPIYLNVGYPIQGFLRLHQAPKNKIRKMSKLEGFASILSSCSTMIWDKDSYNGICNTINKIASCVGCYDLECLPDKAAAELSYSAMKPN